MNEEEFDRLGPVFAKFGRELSEPERAKFIGALQELQSFIAPRLEKQKNPRQFAKAWLLSMLVNELLKYSIEDDYVDVQQFQAGAAKALRHLVSKDDWLDKDLVKFLGACRKAVKAASVPRRVEVTSPSSAIPFIGRIAHKQDAPIAVSTHAEDFVPVLEDSLTDPSYVDNLINGFVDKVSELKQEMGITCLCFIEKAAGPVGALSMLTSLVSKANLPACIYRAGYWASHAKFSGYQPKPSDRVALVYDLIVTGDGLVQAARELRSECNVPMVAAVVLFGYGNKRQEVKFDGEAIKVEAIAWQDVLSGEIEKISKTSVADTKHIKRLSNGRGAFAAAVGRSVTAPPQSEQYGGARMKRVTASMKEEKEKSAPSASKALKPLEVGIVADKIALALWWCLRDPQNYKFSKHLKSNAGRAVDFLRKASCGATDAELSRFACDAAFLSHEQGQSPSHKSVGRFLKRVANGLESIVDDPSHAPIERVEEVRTFFTALSKVSFERTPTFIDLKSYGISISRP